MVQNNSKSYGFGRVEADEALAAYYQRAMSLLRRTHARDRPRDDSASVLSGVENTVMNCIVNAFVKGLRNPDLRKECDTESTTSTIFLVSRTMGLYVMNSHSLSLSISETNLASHPQRERLPIDNRMASK